MAPLRLPVSSDQNLFPVCPIPKKVYSLEAFPHSHIKFEQQDTMVFTNTFNSRDTYQRIISALGVQ